MLGGGPVVYRKLTIKEHYLKKLIGTDNFLQGLFKCFEQEKVIYVTCV